MIIHPLTRVSVVICISSTALLYQHNLILAFLLGVCIVLLLIKPNSIDCRLTTTLIRLLPVIISVFVIQLLFNRQGSRVVDLQVFSVTNIGLDRAVSVTLRLFILLFSGAWLQRLTPRKFNQAFKTVGLPDTFSMLITLTLRFLPKISERIKCTIVQLKTRGIELHRLSLLQRLKLYKTLILPILGWTIRDLKFQAIALDIRGFRNGKKHTVYQKINMKPIDYIIIVSTIVLAFLPLILWRN